jgi:hypothetical protein
MVRTATSRGKRMKAITDPDTIAAIIERRRDGGPPRLKLSMKNGLTPAALVADLVVLHNYLNTRGPTDEWDDFRRWLFNYVDMYKGHLKMEDDMPEIAFRTCYIKAREPFSQSERRYVAEAAELKKQIAKQVRDLKANNVWW